MLKQVDVIFFVEHKDRELEPVELVASKLHTMGYSSMILSTIFHLHYLFLYKAKVFVFPYLISKNDWPVNLVYSIYEDSVCYINLNWEQLIAPVIQEYKKPQDDFVRSVVKHISWEDDAFKDFLLKNGVSNDNIRVTGNPSNFILFELNKAGSLAIRNKLSQEFRLDVKKEWLFMPMNYGWAFLSDKTIKAKIRNGFPENQAWQYRRYSKKCLFKFINFIDEISTKEDCEVIIRPHPGVSVEMYEKKFKEIIGYIPKKVHILKDYTIREWIVASDIIGSSWSTSAYDAQKINKKAFLFFPYEIPVWLHSDWLNKMYKIMNYDEYKKVKNFHVVVEEHNEINNVSFFIQENIVETNHKVKIVNISLKSLAKVTRSFLMNINLICKKTPFSNDKFKKILRIKEKATIK